MTQILSVEPASDDARYHHGDLRQALITAALSLLTEEQNWGFSLREVARRAGVSHNAPYNHFRSKQDLLAAVAAAGFDLLRARMQEAMSQVQTPSAALKAIGVAYVCFGAANPAHYRLMFGTTLPAADHCPPAAVGEAATTAKSVLFDVVRQGMEQGSFAVSPEGLDLAVLSAWSLVHGLTLLLLDGLTGGRSAEADGKAMAEQIAGQVSQVLLDGLSVKANR